MKADCEHCVYYDWDEDRQENVCCVDMDEDEVFRLSEQKNADCPYFKFYDEYKSVQKQN